MMYEIEKGIPVAEAKNGRPYAFPYRELEVGDSFALPNERKFESARRGATRMNKITDKKFVVRRLDEDEVFGRCWRIE